MKPKRVAPEVVSACHAWRPDNPATKKSYEALIERSKQERPKNPWRRGKPMRMWDYMAMSSNPKTAAAGKRIRARLNNEDYQEEFD